VVHMSSSTAISRLNLTHMTHTCRQHPISQAGQARAEIAHAALDNPPVPCTVTNGTRHSPVERDRKGTHPSQRMAPGENRAAVSAAMDPPHPTAVAGATAELLSEARASQCE
jgi:hypothetical protein